MQNRCHLPEMFRLLPVPLPAALLEPGEYMIRDAEGIVLNVTLREAMSSTALADAIRGTRTRSGSPLAIVA